MSDAFNNLVDSIANLIKSQFKDAPGSNIVPGMVVRPKGITIIHKDTTLAADGHFRFSITAVTPNSVLLVLNHAKLGADENALRVMDLESGCMGRLSAESVVEL